VVKHYMAGNKWRFRGGQQRFTHLNPYPTFQQTHCTPKYPA